MEVNKERRKEGREIRGEGKKGIETNIKRRRKEGREGKEGKEWRQIRREGKRKERNGDK